jgi:hypothetical protein
MSDIVERLRTADIYDHADADKFCNEAADEIEKLREALQWLLNDLQDYPASARPIDWLSFARIP